MNKIKNIWDFIVCFYLAFDLIVSGAIIIIKDKIKKK